MISYIPCLRHFTLTSVLARKIFKVLPRSLNFETCTTDLELFSTCTMDGNETHNHFSLSRTELLEVSEPQSVRRKVPSRGTKRSNKSKDISTPYYVSDDSDEDFIPAKVKPSNRADLEKLKSEVGEIKSMVSDILQVNQIIALPIGVVKILKDAFMCKICHITPMKPPVIATTCCNVAWMRGMCEHMVCRK